VDVRRKTTDHCDGRNTTHTQVQKQDSDDYDSEDDYGRMNDYDREAGGGRMMRAAAVVAYKI